MPNLDDEHHQLDRLLEQVRQGSEQARNEMLQELRTFLRPNVDRLLGKKLLIRLDGSDLVQKVLIQVVADFPQFRGQTSGELIEWVRRILERDIQELLQREKFTAKRSIDREEDASHEVRQAPGNQTSPSRRVIRNEQGRIVQEAIEQLTEDCRGIMRMKHIEDLTMAEIARRLGKTESSVARVLVKGMKELKAILKQRGITED